MPTSTGLVVDDDPQVRQLFSRALRQEGIGVVEACSGREALNCAQASTPDFVVTDIQMPDIGGVELCRRLRQWPATARVPVIVVSGAGAAQADDATAAGCDAVLPKPCSPALLLATIQRLLMKPSVPAPKP